MTRKNSRGGVIFLILAAIFILGIAIAGFLFLRGWLQYKHLEKSVIEKMDQYFLDITVPGREEYMLTDDEVFEVPYMASKLSAQPIPTRIYDMHDKLIGEYLMEKGLYIRDPDGIPLLMKRALIATEDGDFYTHHGINYKSLARAILMDIKSRKKVQGGSTLTQQLAKMLFTTRQKTYGRKIFEVFAARKLESKFTKDQILLMYLNFVYFGHGCYGLESASRFYFNKPASDLQLGEAALLAGIISSPDRYSPFNKPELAHARLRTVLHRMAKRGFIPATEINRYEDDFWASMSERFKNPEVSFWRMNVNKSPTFIEFVRRDLVKSYSKERIMKGGLKVYTTLDLDIQNNATTALQQSLKKLNAENTSTDTAKSPIEASFASVRPTDGAILALIGGSAFNFKNQLNRAVDISRPIGSSVKPFIYAVAFSNGAKPEDIVIDEPVHYKMTAGRIWSPHNYEGKFVGPVTLRVALKKSINIVAIKLLSKVGVRPVIELLSEATGSPEDSFPDNLSLALGTAQSSPLRLAAAYSIFVNGGHQVKPYFIRKIEDRDGKVLQDGPPQDEKPKQILDLKAALTTLDLMRGVLEEGGTAYYPARSIGFNIPAAGKTGTTNDFKDAWFAGVTPDLSAAVWTGYDDMRHTLGKGETGGHVAAPVWLNCVKDIYRYRPTREFDMSGLKEVESPSKS